MTPLSKTSIGRDASGEWAWMLTTPNGDLIESDWGYATYEGAVESARQAARRFVRGTKAIREAA